MERPVPIWAFVVMAMTAGVAMGIAVTVVAHVYADDSAHGWIAPPKIRVTEQGRTTQEFQAPTYNSAATGYWAVIECKPFGFPVMTMVPLLLVGWLEDNNFAFCDMWEYAPPEEPGW